MKISFSWQILSEPLPQSTPLNSILKAPIRKMIKEILPDQSSLNTTMQPFGLDSPIIPLIIAYKIQEGNEFQIEAQIKLATNNPIKLLQKRSENKSHIYLLYKIMDFQAYQKILQLLIFIKYGRPESKQLQQLIRQNKTKDFVKMLSSRETSIHSLFIYQKIKKQIIVNEPVSISYKVTDNYVLMTFSATEEINSMQELQILKMQKSQKKQVKIFSIEIMNWLAVGMNFQQVRSINIQKSDEQFVLKGGQVYSLFFKVDVILRGCQIPYVVKWKWVGSGEVFQMLKYIKLQW